MKTISYLTTWVNGKTIKAIFPTKVKLDDIFIKKALKCLKLYFILLSFSFYLYITLCSF